MMFYKVSASIFTAKVSKDDRRNKNYGSTINPPPYPMRNPNSRMIFFPAREIDVDLSWMPRPKDDFFSIYIGFLSIS